VEGKLPPEIIIIDSPLPREIIETLYADHDVSIQVSSHEGLGLGFFESLQKLTPVISMNAAPHNEFIEHNISGILIDCQSMDVDDNKHSIVNAWNFNDEDLCNAILEINKDKVSQLVQNIYDLYNLKFSESAFLIRLDNALQKLSLTPDSYHFENGFIPIFDSKDIEATDSSMPTISMSGPVKRTFLNIAMNYLDKLMSPITVPINRKIRLIIYEGIHEFWRAKSNYRNERDRKLSLILEKINTLSKHRR
jgi:hypothetical protein